MGSDARQKEPVRWVLTAPNAPLARTALEITPPRPGHVWVEVAGCGVCHTDLGFWQGVRTRKELPLALGHEISGRVLSTAAGEERWQGRAVIVPAVIPCGSCDVCVRGKGNICPKQCMPGNDIDGGFATHVEVPARGLCEVDEARLAKAGLALADLSVVADAVTTPYQALTQAAVSAGDVVVVVGVGGVGGYCVQIAAALGAHVVAVDVDADKLELVRAHGAGCVINARSTDGKAMKKEIGRFASERGARATEWKVFECSGTVAGQGTAFSLLVHGSTLGVVGFTMDKVELRLSNLMALHATAQGNWGCVPELYPAALSLVLDGKVQVAPFVERHALDEIGAVFEAAAVHKLKRRAVLVP